MERQNCFEILKENIKNKNLTYHSLAVEKFINIVLQAIREIASQINLD